MSRRSYSSRVLFDSSDSPERIAARKRDFEARQKAMADTKAKFPTVTAENAREQMAYFDERLDFHLGIAK